MKHLTELLTYRALHFKLASLTGCDSLLDRAIDDASNSGELKVKNVCAKLSVELSDRIDGVVGVLDISKRRFIEAAIIAALDEADRVMREVGIGDDPLEESAHQNLQTGGV